MHSCSVMHVWGMMLHVHGHAQQHSSALIHNTRMRIRMSPVTSRSAARHEISHHMDDPRTR